MKKQLFFISFIFLSTLAWAQNVELKSVKTFPNDKDLTIWMDNGEPDSGGIYNRIYCDSNGILFIYNQTTNTLHELDSNIFQTRKKYTFDFSDLSVPKLCGFYAVSKNYFYYRWTDAASIAINRVTGERKYKVNANSLVSSQLSYYDEETDILFFRDHNAKIHCIEHPSLDENQNKKNYRNAEETINLIKSEGFAPHFTLDEDNDLYIDGIRYRWNSTAYETSNYVCTLNQRKKYIRVFDHNESVLLHYSIPEDEEVESITYHPNGDFYFLTINWSTNMHTLWRIENTWDSQWREQWDGEHVVGKVAVNKKMVCNDNLRLRSEEATSSNIITTMSKGTKVKILKLGKAETIDGINSNWVQIELLSDAKDKDGKSIKTGTIGWCYGGYLE